VDDKTEEHLDDCMRGIANAPPATTLHGLHLRADAVWREMFKHMTKDTPRSPLEQAIISVLRDAYELGKPKIDEARHERNSPQLIGTTALLGTEGDD
jgi:hypothetical protein